MSREKLTLRGAVLRIHELLVVLERVQAEKRIRWNDTEDALEGVDQLQACMDLVRQAVTDGVVQPEDVAEDVGAVLRPDLVNSSRYVWLDRLDESGGTIVCGRHRADALRAGAKVREFVPAHESSACEVCARKG